VLLTALTWLPHAREFFSNQGIVQSAAYVKETSPYSHFSIFFWYDAPWFVYTAFAVFILGALGLITGRGGRLGAVVSYVMFLSCASRFPAVFYGAIDVLHSLLFFNMLHPGDGYLPWSSGGVEERNRTVPAWSIRMVQVLFCTIYLMAALDKARVNTWFNGTEIVNSVSTRFGTADFGWLRDYPLFLNALTYFGWMSELAMATLIWSSGARRFVLVAIALMHVGVMVMLNASLFSPTMLVGLSTFLTPADELRIKELWNKYPGPVYQKIRRGWQRTFRPFEG
jgi:hypothetical protein